MLQKTGNMMPSENQIPGAAPGARLSRYLTHQRGETMHIDATNYERVTNIPARAEVTAQVNTAAQQALPPGPDVLRRLEEIAYNLPPVTQNPKAMAWMAALPIALGALNTANGHYTAAVPCFVTGTAVIGTYLLRLMFYPPNILNQLFWR